MESGDGCDGREDENDSSKFRSGQIGCKVCFDVSGYRLTHIATQGNWCY